MIPSIEMQLNSAQSIFKKQGWDDFTTSKVWFCGKTNAIRARFKHNIIGTIGGIVVPGFTIKANMSIQEIRENITPDVFRPTEFYTGYCELIEFRLEAIEGDDSWMGSTNPVTGCDASEE
jgi:hypothetical protein